MMYKRFAGSFAGLKLRELKHRYTYRRDDKKMREAITAYRSTPRAQRKSLLAMMREKAVCRRFWGCEPLHYIRFGFYREDRGLSMDRIKDYIPEFFFYTVFLPRFDPGTYNILLDDKNIAENVFRSLGIPAPRTLCKTVGGRMYHPVTSAEISPEEAARDAAGRGVAKLFLKPAAGEGGHGIRVFSLDPSDGVYRDKSGRALRDDDVKAGADSILQEGLVQEGTLARIYPYSVNTFRIATENIRGEIRIVCAVLRIGNSYNEVDNICQGGIILSIDADSGRTGLFGTNEACAIFEEHPVTGYRFDGFAFEDWDDIRRFALACAAKLPYFTYIGWDIAQTTEGPVAIEANIGFGIDLFQAALGGLRGAFRIDEPARYWKQS